MMTRGKFYKLGFQFKSIQSLFAKKFKQIQKRKREKKRERRKGPRGKLWPRPGKWPTTHVFFLLNLYAPLFSSLADTWVPR
jgi:polyferredoxin